MLDYSIGKEIFKEYILKDYLGEGGFGKVYRVENRIGLPFALKVLYRDVHMEKRGVESVMRIRSNRLVSILDYGETVNGEDCILMEYVRDNLEGILEEEALTPENACRYMAEVLKGLKVLEENGILMLCELVPLRECTYMWIFFQTSNFSFLSST